MVLQQLESVLRDPLVFLLRPFLVKNYFTAVHAEGNVTMMAGQMLAA